MPRAKEFLEPDQVQEPSVSERNPPRKPIGCAEDWRDCLDSGREKGPTSAHEEEGWRALKLF